jgi:hypothetical protein
MFAILRSNGWIVTKAGGDFIVSHVRFVVAAVVSAASLFAATADSANAYSERVRRACKGDYHRLCGQYKVDSAQLRSCMEANAFSISSPCITALVDSGEVDGSKVRKRR